MSSRLIQLSLVQMKVTENVDSNIEKALTLAKASQNHTKDISENENPVKVIIFPEMFTTGFNNLSTIIERAHSLSNPTFLSPFIDIAQTYGGYLVLGSLPLKTEGNQDSLNHKVTNTTLIINPKGEIISRYDKCHLFPLMEEHDYLSAGKKTHLFSIEDIPCSSMICYDLRFPKMMLEVIKQKKIDLLFIPVQWPSSRAATFKILAQARAIENKCFVVLVNCVGTDSVGHFTGGSLVIDPMGKILKEMNEKEEVVNFTIDLKEIENIPLAVRNELL